MNSPICFWWAIFNTGDCSSPRPLKAAVLAGLERKWISLICGSQTDRLSSQTACVTAQRSRTHCVWWGWQQGGEQPQAAVGIEAGNAAQHELFISPRYPADSQRTEVIISTLKDCTSFPVEYSIGKLQWEHIHMGLKPDDLCNYYKLLEMPR